MKIALDLEGVLADVTGRLEDHQGLNDEDLKSWGCSSEEQLNKFLAAMEQVWKTEHLAIQPMSDNLPGVVEQMNDRHTVDIVTGRTGVDIQVRDWLAKNYIEYNDLRPVDHYKHKLDDEYDVFIDDNPHMVEDDLDAALLVRDQPWNDHIDTHEKTNVRRVESLRDALFLL